MPKLQSNAESLIYLQECIADLQNQFYGLQLEQLQKERFQLANQIPSISSNSIWSTNKIGSESSGLGRNRSESNGFSSGIGSESDTSSMRSTSPDLKVLWPIQSNYAKQQQQAAVKTALQQQVALAATLKQQQQLQQQQALAQAKQSCQTSMLPIGSNSNRFVSQQSIHLAAKTQAAQAAQSQLQSKTQKYIPPNKKQFNQKNTSTKPLQQDQNKQGPYNKVLIVGLSQEYRSLNGVLNIFRPYGDVVSARVYRPYSTLPNEITRWCPSVEVQDSFAAVVEYPTARCAKFAVGVLRERVQANKYRVVLLKPGAYEELQRQKMLIFSSENGKKTEKSTNPSNPESDSGNESLEVLSSRNSDCISD